MSQIYLGTVLLEKNRWRSRVPSIKPTEWVRRAAQAGFDGFEVWEKHVLEQEGELEGLAACKFPTPMFNCYANFLTTPNENYHQIARAVAALECRGVKYNFAASGDLEASRATLMSFADMLPDYCRPLCECHEGTMLEDFAVAGRFFADMPARFGVIMHAVGDLEQIKRDYIHVKDRLAHLHVQVREPEVASGNLERCVKFFLDKGFNGSWTVEFTRCSHGPIEQENTFEAFCMAMDDLSLLREFGV